MLIHKNWQISQSDVIFIWNS